MIEEAQTVFLTCTDTNHGLEALGVVIWPQYEIPYVDAFVINDITNATEALQQRTMQIVGHCGRGRRASAPDIFLETLPLGTKVSVVLKRAVIEDDVYNLVKLDLE